MKCPHCLTSFFDNASRSSFVMHSSITEWNYETRRCPECRKLIINIWHDDDKLKIQVVPNGSSRGPIPPEVPPFLANDYQEACNVLHISSKASAALSRRCLQATLSAHGYNGRDLAKQIESALSEQDTSKSLPSVIRDTIDAVRNFGNFSAHPINDQTTFQIIDVEPQEAEWCLQIIEELFDHFYVRPAAAAARKLALNEKLAAAGKPPAK